MSKTRNFICKAGKIPALFFAQNKQGMIKDIINRGKSVFRGIFYDIFKRELLLF
jgi:hypothetical protein